MQNSRALCILMRKAGITMPNNESLNPAQRELEAALARLTPAASGLDHDELLYRAGQASVRRRCQAWQFSAAVTTLLFVGLLIWQPRTTPGESIVYVPVQPAPALPQVYL